MCIEDNSTQCNKFSRCTNPRQDKWANVSKWEFFFLLFSFFCFNINFDVIAIGRKCIQLEKITLILLKKQRNIYMVKPPGKYKYAYKYMWSCVECAHLGIAVRFAIMTHRHNLLVDLLDNHLHTLCFLLRLQIIIACGQYIHICICTNHLINMYKWLHCSCHVAVVYVYDDLKSKCRKKYLNEFHEK